jgi:hypothetical protein
MRSESLLPAHLDGRLRPLCGRDEELLVARRGGNAAALCNELLARCLVPIGRDPRGVRDEVAALPVHDRDLALVALRRLTYSDQLAVELACTECNARHDVSIDLDRLARPPDPPRELAIEAGGRRIEVRLPTAGDQAIVGEQDGGDLGARRAQLLALALIAIDDRRGPFELAGVAALDRELREAIEAAVENAMPDIDLALIAACPACEAAIEAPVQLAQLVLAELRERSRHLLREIHMLARDYHWSERHILALSVPRRRAYLALLDADRDAALYAEAIG